ncbi:MAG: zinc metalloprotease HtpX [Coxiellaceae bacterium]|jgi:heat shock protein HtpX|nr:zinc metalloprotease HtpX [Coxiellaceae bacterium]
MKIFTDYTASAVDWRQQLKSNEWRTRMVIAVFILIYALIGLIVDLYLHPEFNQIPIFDALEILITFQVVPVVTLILGFIAVVSILITYTLHDRLMLLGTEYYEVKPGSTRNFAEQQLYNVTEELKIAAGLRYMPKIYLINADYMNAFASGYSEKSALIAITRGVLSKLDRSELQAVIAHELNHIRHHDIKLTLMASVLSNIALIVLDIMFRSALISGSRGKKRGNGLVLVVFLLRFLLPIITVLLMLYLSRKREFMADAGAVELIRDNVPLAKALLKISNDHIKDKDQYTRIYQATAHEEVRREAYVFDPTQAGISLQQSISDIFSTHPPLEARLQALGFQAKK